MFRELLADRVRNTVLRMREGEEFTVAGVAQAEGVTKSPQLYRILDTLTTSGHVTQRTIASRGSIPTIVYTRTSKELMNTFDGFGSGAEGEL